MVDYFGDDVEVIHGKKWDWENFKTTEDYPVSPNLLDWVIGQERALNECYLCLEEWVHKLKQLEREKWFKAWRDPDRDKPSLTKNVPPGPYLLLLGERASKRALRLLQRPQKESVECPNLNKIPGDLL